MSATCLFESSLASVTMSCLMTSLCCAATYWSECSQPTAHTFDIEAFDTAIVHGGFFLNFAVSVNWIGPGFQRKVRGAPFHPSFSWSAASPTVANPTIPAMPIAAAPMIFSCFPPEVVFTTRSSRCPLLVPIAEFAAYPRQAVAVCASKNRSKKRNAKRRDFLEQAQNAHRSKLYRHVQTIWPHQPRGTLPSDFS